MTGITAKVSIKFQYTQAEVQATKKEIKQEVIDSIEGSPELRAEMRKTFQQANRRIQNIEQAGLMSPAVEALGKGDMTGYSKFSVAGFGNTGEDWEHLKQEYAKAINFMQQPTSTASGARTWQTQVQQELGIDDGLFHAIADTVTHEYNNVVTNRGYETYREILQAIYDMAVESASDWIEQQAIADADRIEKDIDRNAEQIANDAVDEVIEALERAFKM